MYIISWVSLIVFKFRYAIFSSMYYFLEKYKIQNTFFCGLGKSCKESIEEIRISSEVKDNSNKYYFWIETTTSDSKVKFLILPYLHLLLIENKFR